MSFNFIIKDAAHHSIQTKSYLKSVGATVALSTLFLNIVQSLGIFIKPEVISQFNDTIITLFTQYNTLLVIFTSLLTILFIINSNHALIQHRKKDMTIMRAVGTLPRKLYSFYLSQLIFLAFIGSIIGWFVGFAVFLIFFIIAEGKISALQWNPNLYLSIILLVGIILLTYVINGWEIRKIGMKSYSETTSGKLKENLSAKIGGKFGTWLKKRNLSFSLAIKNLIRKKYEIRQNLVLISFAGMIMLTSILGVFVVNSSSRTYIENAQSDNIVIIGHQGVINAMHDGYASFTDPTINPLSDQTFLNLEYNISDFQNSLMALCEEYDIISSKIEERLYTQMNISERVGWVLGDPHDNLNEGPIEDIWDPEAEVPSSITQVGVGGREQQVILQGFSFNSSLIDWTTYGTYENETSGGFIGDSVAANIFEIAYYQSFDFYVEETNLTQLFPIHAVVIDTLANGNTAYIPIDLLRTVLNRPNYTNLMMVDFMDLSLDQQESFLEDLNALVQAQLGSEFGVVNLSPVFQENLDSMSTITMISLILGMLMVIIILYSLNQYQKGRITEDTHDLSIMKMLGVSMKENQRIIFYEQLGIIILGITLSLIFSMIFIILFLFDTSSLPSVFLPLGAYLLSLIILTTVSFINSIVLSKRIKIRLETNFR